MVEATCTIVFTLILLLHPLRYTSWHAVKCVFSIQSELDRQIDRQILFAEKQVQFYMNEFYMKTLGCSAIHRSFGKSMGFLQEDAGATGTIRWLKRLILDQ